MTQEMISKPSIINKGFSETVSKIHHDDQKLKELDALVKQKQG